MHVRFRNAKLLFITLALLLSTTGNAQTSPQQVDQEVQFVNMLTNWPLAIIKASLALGFITMSIVETIKIFYRPGFNRRRVRYWLLGYPFGARMGSKESKYEQSIHDLLLLAGGDKHRGFYDLPIQNISGQISLAAQTVLESPNTYYHLLHALLGKSQEKRDVQLDVQIVTEMSSRTNLEDPLYFEARNRLANHIQRNIDVLQISTTFLWKRWMQLFCVVTSFGIALCGTLLFANNVGSTTQIITIILTGYLGAFLATFIRDLFGLLQRNKNENS